MDAEVLLVLSLRGSAAPNIGVLARRRTAFPGAVEAVRCRVTAGYGCPFTGYCRRMVRQLSITGGK